MAKDPSKVEFGMRPRVTAAKLCKEWRVTLDWLFLGIGDGLPRQKAVTPWAAKKICFRGAFGVAESKENLHAASCRTRQEPQMTTDPKKPEAEEPAAEIVSIKGFHLDWTCRDFQYAIGATYEHAGEVKACETGFHAVGPEGHPLEVFGYYAPATSRYAEVRQSGALSRQGSDGKVASARIAIVAEITMPDLIGRAIKWVMDRATPEGGRTATGHHGAASATGHHGAASATGGRGAASATGHHGAASATGHHGAASATGHHGAASATGYQGAASAIGYQGAASAIGDRGAASATGKHGIALAGGYEGKAMAAEGCALFLVSRDYATGKIIHAWAGIAGRDGIKPLVWYTLGVDGKPVEAI